MALLVSSVKPLGKSRRFYEKRGDVEMTYDIFVHNWHALRGSA